MKTILLVLLVVIVSTMCIGCAQNPVITVSGKLIDQSVDNGFFFTLAQYTLLMEDGTEYTFKVRSGWSLIINQEYVFKMRHIEDGEYIADSIEQTIK
jgi:predicted small secreted protein